MRDKREPRAVILSEAKDLALSLGFSVFEPRVLRNRGVTGRLATGLGELVLTLAREHTMQAGLSVAGDACGEVFVRGRRSLALNLTARSQPAAPHTL